MAFITDKVRDRLRRARKKFYDDIVEFRVASGSDAMIAGPVTYSHGGDVITDAWDRPNIDPARYPVTTKSIVVSGTFTWVPASERRPIPAGMAEDGEAIFACSDEYRQVLSGSRMFALRDGEQLEIVRTTPANTTGEIVVVMGRTRRDNLE